MKTSEYAIAAAILVAALLAGAYFGRNETSKLNSMKPWHWYILAGIAEVVGGYAIYTVRQTRQQYLACNGRTTRDSARTTPLDPWPMIHHAAIRQ